MSLRKGLGRAACATPDGHRERHQAALSCSRSFTSRPKLCITFLAYRI